MGIIVLFVIAFIIIGIGFSFFSGPHTNASRNSHSVFTQDAYRDDHKDRVNKSMKQQRFLDNDYDSDKEDAKKETQVVLKDQRKQHPLDNEDYDDFFKEYDDFFEQDDDPFNK